MKVTRLFQTGLMTVFTFVFLVSTGGVGWAADPIDFSKPYARTNPYVAGAGVAAAAASCAYDSFDSSWSGHDTWANVSPTITGPIAAGKRIVVTLGISQAGGAKTLSTVEDQRSNTYKILGSFSTDATSSGILYIASAHLTTGLSAGDWVKFTFSNGNYEYHYARFIVLKDCDSNNDNQPAGTPATAENFTNPFGVTGTITATTSTAIVYCGGTADASGDWTEISSNAVYGTVNHSTWYSAFTSSGSKTFTITPGNLETQHCIWAAIK